MKKTYDNERDNNLLGMLDKYIGIPLIFLLGMFKIRNNNLGEIKKIALLKTAAIGDTVILSAIIQDIINAIEGAEITLFTASSNYTIATIIAKQHKNQLTVVKLPIQNPFKTIKIIKNYQFDLWLDFGPWPRINAVISFFANANHKFGFKTKKQYRHYIYDNYATHQNNTHELNNYRNILKIAKIEPLQALPTLQAKFAPANHAVIHMSPGGSKRHLKIWQDNKWIETINYLTKKGLIVKLSGAQTDIDNVKNIQSKCEMPNKVEVIAGKINLEELFNVLKGSRLVISIDTGIMHLASALQCNLIALHGPTSPQHWGPLNKNSFTVYAKVKCSPCLRLGFEGNCTDNICMQAISTKIVRKNIDAILDRQQKISIS